MSTTTTFYTTADLVHSFFRSPDFLRSAIRNERIDGCTIANRSNYTRVRFDGETSAAFLVPVGPYSVRIRATPNCGATVVVNGLHEFERVGMAVSSWEMRAMAYGLLAAANWIDSRDDDRAQQARRPAPKNR